MKQIITLLALAVLAIGCGKPDSYNVKPTAPPVTTVDTIAAATTDTAVSADGTTKLAWYEYGVTDSTRILQVTLSYPNNNAHTTFNDTLYLYTGSGINWKLQEGFHDNQYSTDAMPNGTSFQLFIVRTTSGVKDTIISMHRS